LVGEKVRFDGGHKLDRYLTDVLGEWVEWVAVCPEVEIGLGIPRPAIRLEGATADPRLVEPEAGTDLTERVERYANRRVRELQRIDLDGYVLLRSHNEAGYRRCGRVVADAGKLPGRELFGVYEAEFHSTLRWKTTSKRHTNVLYHVLGYLKKVLEPAEKQELATLIEDYRAGLVPLIVPITLLRHYVRKHGIENMSGQLYLEPHPKELMLRNRV
jgi:uncharacterized protein YbgA (DUF1722 family)